ncbi:MAG: hypothetical protein EAZ25_25160 [Oscillatoriales cyanobacterium]|nr:MAG: hypothetical protein EAZ25_25160 [Oscillatoriales cyanobacterium]
MQANISVGAKHDRRKYGIITNNLYAVMLRPLQKPDAPDFFFLVLDRIWYKVEETSLGSHIK